MQNKRRRRGSIHRKQIGGRMIKRCYFCNNDYGKGPGLTFVRCRRHQQKDLVTKEDWLKFFINALENNTQLFYEELKNVKPKHKERKMV